MNREIKFRIWDGEDMLYLLPTEIQWFDYENGFVLSFSDEGYKQFYAHECFPDRNCDFPIMQYTGLKDKNGVEIYEGDLVKYAKKETFCKKCDEKHRLYSSKFCPVCGSPVVDEDFERVAEIRFNKGGFCFYEEQHHSDGNTYTAWQTFISEFYIEWKEVIGNIHQNPDLL